MLPRTGYGDGQAALPQLPPPARRLPGPRGPVRRAGASMGSNSACLVTRPRVGGRLLLSRQRGMGVSPQEPPRVQEDAAVSRCLRWGHDNTVRYGSGRAGGSPCRAADAAPRARSRKCRRRARGQSCRRFRPLLPASKRGSDASNDGIPAICPGQTAGTLPARSKLVVAGAVFPHASRRLTPPIAPAHTRRNARTGDRSPSAEGP
jgi:hypothetical protein